MLSRQAWLPVVFAAVVGCDRGPRVYPVEGKLVYADDAPVPGRASVTFHREVEGKPYAATGRVEADGTFRLTTVKNGDGAVAGENGVSVTPIPGGEEAVGVTVGPQYGSTSTSGLKVTVEPGVNRPVLKIERPGKR